jgi:hypothetical protein
MMLATALGVLVVAGLVVLGVVVAAALVVLVWYLLNNRRAR